MLSSLKKRYLLIFIIPVLSGLIFYSFPLSVPEVKAQSAATTSLSVSITLCGNNNKEAGEECDGPDLGGQNCAGLGLGYGGGDLSCNTNCTFNTSACIRGGPSGWVSPVRETKVVLRGKAYPDVPISILIDGEVVTIIRADSQGDFKAELTTLTAGIYTFGLRAEDKEGRESITFSFSLTVSHRITTTISGIFLPPTIELEKTFLNQGEVLNISGQTAPQSKLNIHIESSEEVIIKKTTADNQGEWNYSLDTSELKEGFYFAKAESISPEGLISSFSSILKFGIDKRIEEVCPGTDLNKDRRVDLVDFSILLYWWETDNACADQNQDGTVNLQDFSIMMYYWTG